MLVRGEVKYTQKTDILHKVLIINIIKNTNFLKKQLGNVS